MAASHHPSFFLYPTVRPLQHANNDKRTIYVLLLSTILPMLLSLLNSLLAFGHALILFLLVKDLSTSILNSFPTLRFIDKKDIITVEY